MHIACLDLEGVLIPEIWIALAERTGIAELRRTTRDEPDYDRLMRFRIGLLAEKRLGLPDIARVVAAMRPLPGAQDFLAWLRERFQTIIVSDTFYETAMPLVAQLGYPALFCHRLQTDRTGRVTGYRLRQPAQKQASVRALRGLNFRVIAAGDSYNDTAMLAEADAGILFHPPENVRREFPQYPIAEDYESLKREFLRASEAL
jgi:phosphoserine/homoserine phosphotransferase